MKTTLLRVDWIESSDQRAPLGCFHPIAIYRYGSAAVMACLTAAMAAMQYLCRTRGPRAHPMALGLLLVAPLLSAGCTAPAQDVANQAAIRNREALADVRATYAATERTIVSLHKSGTLSTERATALVKELQTVARPAIDAAQAALVSGDFDTAIIKAVQAVGAVTTKAAPPVVVHP